MLVIAGLKKDQGHQEVVEIEMIVTGEGTGMKREDIDLQEEKEMIIEEETEEAQMIEMEREVEEETEVIQEIEEEIIIESVLEMKEREVTRMIKKEAEDTIIPGIKVSRKEADQDLTVKIEKIDMKNILRKAIEEIEKKEQTTMNKIRHLKMVEMDKSNINLQEKKVKVPKISLNKMII